MSKQAKNRTPVINVTIGEMSALAVHPNDLIILPDTNKEMLAATMLLQKTTVPV
jgi:hypothetical protein